MKSDLNLVQLIGTVYKEPKQDAKYNKVGFVLQNMRYKTKPEKALVPMFVNIECFEDIASMAANLQPNDRLFISGTLSIRSYKKQDGTMANWVSVVANTMEKLGKKNEDKEDELFNQDVNSSDIPFN